MAARHQRCASGHVLVDTHDSMADALRRRGYLHRVPASCRLWWGRHRDLQKTCWSEVVNYSLVSKHPVHGG